MKYKLLAEQIQEYVNDEQMPEVLNLVIGKAINQERIQIYKTLLIYFPELEDKNKTYLANKIRSNEAMLRDREDKLTGNLGVKLANLNEFFDVESGVDKLKVLKKLLKDPNITLDEAMNIYGAVDNLDEAVAVGERIENRIMNQLDAPPVQGRTEPAIRPTRINALFGNGGTTAIWNTTEVLNANNAPATTGNVNWAEILEEEETARQNQRNNRFAEAFTEPVQMPRMPDNDLFEDNENDDEDMPF